MPLMNTVVEDVRKSYSPLGLEKGSSEQDREAARFMVKITLISSCCTSYF